MTHAEKEARNNDIVKMRHDGKSMAEIADAYGLTISGVGCICKRYGVAGVMSDRKAVVKNPRNQYTNGKFNREANAIRYINERVPDFEYAGKFTGLDGFVDLKCKVCGTIERKSFVSVKHGVARCQTCYEKSITAYRENKKAIHARKISARRLDRERTKWEHMTFAQTSFIQCKCCGDYFIPTNGQKYCSTVCAKRISNAVKKDKRIRKVRRAVVDRDITIQRLYEREKGKCYICGCTCDWNDYTRNENGAFISGNNYPSIDHVIPLSKGGKHSWDNVRLACRGCNIKKGDGIAPLVKK